MPTPDPSPSSGYFGTRVDPGGEPLFIVTSAPDSTTHAGSAHPGAVVIDRSTGTLYKNTGTLVAPTWTSVGTFREFNTSTLDARSTRLRNRALAIAAGHH